MEIAGNSNAETSTAFLRQLREKHPGPLVVIWDNRFRYLTTPNLSEVGGLTGYSPGRRRLGREEVTANECLGTKAKVQEKVIVRMK